MIAEGLSSKSMISFFCMQDNKMNYSPVVSLQNLYT